MTMNSHVPAGSSGAMFVQAAGMFALAENRGSRLGQLSGPLPKGEGKVAEMIRKQSSSDFPIVKAMDLSRGTGDEVEYWSFPADYEARLETVMDGLVEQAAAQDGGSP